MTRTVSHLGGGLVAATLLVSGDVAAQELRVPAPRQGYYMSVGAYGVLDSNYDQERWFRGWPGFSANLRVGQGLFEWLDVGVALDFGFAAGKKRQASIGGISAEVQVHPFTGLAVRAGTGFGVLSVAEKTAESNAESTGGIGAYFNLGIAYDWFPLYRSGSGGWALSPVIQARLMPREETSAFLVWFGVELTWWLGLPNNQLDLPVGEAFTS